MNAKPIDIDAYLAGLTDEQRATLESMSRTILAIAPEAVESISYGIPTFKLRGRPLAYIGAAKNHCALYGFSVDAFTDDLAAYDVEKGTIRYPIGEPLPEPLVRKLLEARMAEIETAITSKGKKRPSQAKEQPHP